MDMDWTRIFTQLISVTVAYLLALPVAWDREKEVSFKEGVNARSLKLDGTETFDIVGLKDGNRAAGGSNANPSSAERRNYRSSVDAANRDALWKSNIIRMEVY